MRRHIVYTLCIVINHWRRSMTQSRSHSMLFFAFHVTFLLSKHSLHQATEHSRCFYSRSFIQLFSLPRLDLIASLRVGATKQINLKHDFKTNQPNCTNVTSQSTCKTRNCQSATVITVYAIN